MKYLLDSGEQSDSRLVFRLEGGGAAYGFRAALELPCHRVVLAARSRFFRYDTHTHDTQHERAVARYQWRVLRGRVGGVGGVSGGVGGVPGAVCADERVLPRRFARALLHAAYTDQVDLGLIGRNSPSPASTGSAPSVGTVDLGLIGRNSPSPASTGSAPSVGTTWSGVSRSSPRPNNTSTLDDAFQLYEIARFLEMPIVVQGCEDAIVEALSADTLPHVLRWAAAPHASQWVHRQAMRYLRDEFPSIMCQTSSVRLPRSAVAEALSSPFLQASEAQALRALLRWAERAAAPKHALHDTRGAVRRGAVPQPPPQMLERGAGADAWLGRGASRPPRCFLPYLDEIKALLEDQAVPEAEVSRVRRARYLHRIPDTLYMVAAARSGASSASVVGGAGGAVGGASGAVGGAGGAVGGAEAACVSPRVLAALRARVRELRAAPPAQRALLLHATDTKLVHHQVAAARSGASSASVVGGAGGAVGGASGAVGGAGGAVGGAEAACVSPRVLAALRARVRELRAAPPAQRALLLHATDTKLVHHQV
ncbi:BTB/POZ domain-containing protein 7 [Papilio machaon]|uniref:BTB/POZ domain-containing protein 7 n=1 Tax=Papilio machaon TaxID=76193 RepID=A0A0N1PHP7_PAPMA|nr:BTB/POZ domain-containing protein 7 [Papilio machaon]